jgi:hypothetical protein
VLGKVTGNFIYPDMETRGSFQCSSPLYNAIHELITQAMRSNIKSIFTDCPHREKLGWLEETHLVGPAMLFQYDLAPLYKKIQQDMADAQQPDGLVPSTCPDYVKGLDQWHTGFRDSPEWGSAFIINPWRLYEHTGDLSLAQAHYPAMKKYAAYLQSKTHHHILRHGLGDWLDVGPIESLSQNTPPALVATAVYYYDLLILWNFARLLGHPADEEHYAALAQQVKAEYIAFFYDKATGRFANGSQTAQAMSLLLCLTPKGSEGFIRMALERDIQARGCALTAGDVGHAYLFAALTQYNASHLVCEMLNQMDSPGYGYQVKHGATTLTERWDGPNPAKPLGSQNHLMLGAANEWFYSGLGGMRLFHTGNGFDRILLRPHFAQGLSFVRARHRHPKGLLAVEWERRDRAVYLALAVPPGTTAVFENELDGIARKLKPGFYEFTLPDRPKEGASR